MQALALCLGQGPPGGDGGLEALPVGELGWALAVVDGRDVAANLVLAVADDAAVAVALAGELDHDLDRLAGLVLDGEDPAGVDIDLIGHGRWRSGEEAGAVDPDIQVDPALGPGVARPVDAAGGAGAELEIHPGGGFAPAIEEIGPELEDQIHGLGVAPAEVGGGDGQVAVVEEGPVLGD